MKRLAGFISILLLAAMMCTVLIGCRKDQGNGEKETQLPTMQVEEETEIEIGDGAAIGGF